MIGAGTALLMIAAAALGQDTIDVRPTFTLGQIDGPGHSTFGLIAGLAGNQAGEMLLSDAQLARVQVFDSTGAYLRSVGRRGVGPGEMQTPAEITFLTAGRWVVTDVGRDAYLWFDSLGNPLGRFIRPRDRPFRRDVIRSDGKGRLYDSRQPRDAGADSFHILRIELVTPPDDMRVDSVWLPFVAQPQVRLVDEATGFDGGDMDIPFRPMTVWTPFGGGIAFSRDGSYAIDITGPNGAITRFVNRPDHSSGRIPTALREQVRRESEERLTRLATQVGTSADAWVDQLVLPDRFPSVLNLFTDPAGRLWVLGGGPYGRPVMEVWSREGEFLGAMRLLGDRWPDTRTLTVSGTHVLARSVLESGLHQVWAFPIPLELRASGSGER